MTAARTRRWWSILPGVGVTLLAVLAFSVSPSTAANLTGHWKFDELATSGAGDAAAGKVARMYPGARGRVEQLCAQPYFYVVRTGWPSTISTVGPGHVVICPPGAHGRLMQ